MKFDINLINYSSYSFGFGMLTIKEIVQKSITEKRGYASLTDYNTLVGIPEFVEECEKNKIKPLIGVTLSVSEDKKYLGDLSLIAINEKGYEELKRIVTELKTFNVADFNSIQLDKLIEICKNVIVIDGAKNSIGYKLNREEYIPIYKKLQESYKNKLVITIQPEKDIEHLKEHVKKMMNVVFSNTIKRNDEDYNNKVFFSNNNRFLTEKYYPFQAKKAQDHSYLKTKLKVKKLKTIKEVIDETDHFLSDELFYNYLGRIKERIEEKNKNTILNESSFIGIFNSINLWNEPHFPKLSNAKLGELIKQNWKEYSKDIPTEKHPIYIKRIKEELETIKKLGFEDYFLLISDINKIAKELNQKTAVRGSAAASLILNVIGISIIDPVKHNLMFSRFLNTGRHELPDIDFETSANKELLTTLKERYGNVYALLKLNKIDKYTVSKNFVFESLRYYKGLSIEEEQNLNKREVLIDKAIKDFLKGRERDIPMSEMLRLSKGLQNLYGSDDYVKQIINYAIKMEGQHVNKSINIGSVIFADNIVMPIIENETLPYIEATKIHIQNIGSLKMDILSSKILENLQKLESLTGYSLNKISDDLSNKKVYEEFRNINLFGINQLGSGLKIENNTFKGIGAQICSETKISNFEELAVVCAVIRDYFKKPEQYVKFLEGKENPDKIEYKHPLLKKSLSETYGAFIYEEQIMLIAKDVAGFDDIKADLLRTGIKKEKKEIVDKLKPDFISGALANGVNEEIAYSIYQDLENRMGQYQFNKSHAYVYSILSYQEMFYKINYPAEYYHIHLNDKNNVYLVENEIVKMGYSVLRPDINVSEEIPRTIIQEIKNNSQVAIDLSLSRVIKNKAILDNIIKERQEYGFYEDILDYMERVLPIYTGISLFSPQMNVINNQKNISSFKQDLVNLITVGAFDKLNNELSNDFIFKRNIMLFNLDSMLDAVLNINKNIELNLLEPLKENILTPEQFIVKEKDILLISPISVLNMNKQQKHIKRQTPN